MFLIGGFVIFWSILTYWGAMYISTLSVTIQVYIVAGAIIIIPLLVGFIANYDIDKKK